MERALNAYGRCRSITASLEVTTAATYQMAELYRARSPRT